MIISLREATLATGGGKAVGLGRLVEAGFPVPDGFVISAEVYRQAVANLDLADLLARGGAGAVRDAVEAQALPEQVVAPIREYLAAWGGDVAVAVRSSATAEDLPEASFAGQQDTFLGVVGVDAVCAAVRSCWASLWTNRAVNYRQRHNIDHTEVAIAVIVQRLIDATTAGVLFTVDPISGAEETVINASWGLGESVVAGAVTPDDYRVSGNHISVQVGAKQSRLDRSGSQTIRTETPNEVGKRCLTDDQVRELAAVGREVHEYFAMPMDVEWAYDDQLWLLQARPITTIPAKTDTSSIAEKPGRKPSRLARIFRQDLVEHYPGPYPLDLLAITRVHRQLQFGMAQIGVYSTPITELIEMSDDGTITVAYPQVRFSPKLLRLLNYPSPDPDDWPTVEQEFRKRLTAIGIPADDAPHTTIIDALDRTLALVDDIARTRFLDYLGPAMLLSIRLKAMLKLARRADLTPYDLLGQLDYTTTVINRELQRLAALSPESESTCAEITQFLDSYGANTSKMYLPFSQRSWRENLEQLSHTLAAIRRQSVPEHNPPSHDDLIASITKRLPRFTRSKFKLMVQRWRAGHIAREASLYMIEEAYVQARVLMDILANRMYKNGYLNQASDIKLLTFAEVTAALNQELTIEHVQKLIALRHRHRPEAAARWWGNAAPTRLEGEATLTGTPGSPGRASGPARIITSTADFYRLQPGDVLICQYTDPTWTPLFSLACAVVADTGGQLSHAAIVAREYAIPAVMGTQNATSTLTDGQIVTVDGTKGTITLT